MMNTHTASNVDDYVIQFEAIKHRVDDDQVAAVILEQIAKDARTERIAATRNGNGANGGRSSGNGADTNGTENGNGAAATQKQRGYLKDLGVKVPKGLTKHEASKLIEEAKAE